MIRASAAAAPAIPYLAVAVGLNLLGNAWLALLGCHIGMLAVLLIARPRIGALPPVGSRGSRIVAATGALGAASGPLLLVASPSLRLSGDLPIYLSSIGLTAAAWPEFIFYFVLVNPWLEEFYWRGYLGSEARGPVLNDFLYAGYHGLVLAGRVAVPWLAAILLVMAGAAWLWRQADRGAGGLLPSCISHLAADLTVLLAIHSMTLK